MDMRNFGFILSVFSSVSIIFSYHFNHKNMLFKVLLMKIIHLL